MKKIEKLTPEQEIDLKDTLAKWLNIGRRTTPLDRPKVKRIMEDLYARIGEKSPMVFYFDSPMQCILAWAFMKGNPTIEKLLDFKGSNLRTNLQTNLRTNMWTNLRTNLRTNLWTNLRTNLWTNLRTNLEANLWTNLETNLQTNLQANLGNYFGGNQWCSWKVFYDFGNRIGCKFTEEDRKLLDLWLEESSECHWWYPYKGIVLMCEHPTICKVNAQGKLHSENSMASQYKDGWGIWSLNGVTMKEEHIMVDAEKMESSIILKETNVEVRRELLRKVGIERMLENLPHRVLDTKGDYSLISVDLSDELLDCKYLRMLNPSIGVWHLEGVTRECKTVQQAINWRAGDINEAWEPAQLT